ncbi:hypothetical protein HY224_02940, partial [Candidatus Uhrbacteria bacterium]|nr:hypothetical protein [Candidatus Uhrbacteria bacterium]
KNILAAPLMIEEVIEPALHRHLVVKEPAASWSQEELNHLHPNTSPIQIEIKSDTSLLKSARAGFYLGLIVGVVAMSLLVIIAYISFLTNLLYKS